ncbi:hypothetical protein D3C85_903670 [compost metagenome]
MLGCQPPCSPRPRLTGRSTCTAGRKIQASAAAASAAGSAALSQRRRARQPNASAASATTAYGSQPCSAGKARPRLDSSTDGSGDHACRMSGRRSSTPYQTKSCSSTGVLRSGAMTRAAQRAAKGCDDSPRRPRAMPSAVASGIATSATVSVLTSPAAIDIQ